MNKLTIIVVSVTLFQTAAYAEDQQVINGDDAVEPVPVINMPEVGSQYDLDGIQTQNGQSKSSYSTKSVDTRKSVDGQYSIDHHQNRSGNNPVGAGVIIVVDE